ncbi:MAG: transposase [Planctomycetota bacterium]
MTKPHRLASALYRGTIRITFSLRLNTTTAFFNSPGRVDPFVAILADARTKHACRNRVYIFMPDHMHVLNEGLAPDSDLLKMMYLFKQKTGYWLAKHGGGVMWQPGFYDHIHRQEEDLRKHIRYILDNPVRKGIVGHWNDHPFTGSLDFPISDII